MGTAFGMKTRPLRTALLCVWFGGRQAKLKPQECKTGVSKPLSWLFLQVL